VRFPTAVLDYTAREGDVGIMQRCLQEKFGYRSS